MKFVHIETVNFYGDPIDLAITDEGMPYVSLSQITGYLSLDFEKMVERFENDPRVELSEYRGTVILPLSKFNGFLMLIPMDEVSEDTRDDLMRYQVECFGALHDYWINGVALNRREIPYDIKSKFTDERVVSRKVLIDACAKFCKDNDALDPHDIFDKALSMSYKIIGLDPKHEYEKLSGAEARYLAWVESVFATTINKFATWGESPRDVIKEALPHVEEHLRKTGLAWVQMADNVPATLYN